jgi:hypothetical protein
MISKYSANGGLFFNIKVAGPRQSYMPVIDLTSVTDVTHPDSFF